jgi:hypothetical protein
MPSQAPSHGQNGGWGQTSGQVSGGTCSLEAVLHSNKSEFSAAKTINSFQKSALGGERITAGQMEQMAKCGTITKNDGTTISVPPDVQGSAMRFMRNDGQLFKKLESSTDGKCDGELGLGDLGQALSKGRLSFFK